MKKALTLLTSLLLVIFIGNLSAQTSHDGRGIVPLKSPNSVTYGTDVIIHNNPAADQRNTCLSVAYNGWLYAAYTLTTGGFKVAKSVDNGATWVLSDLIWSNYYFPKVDIVVTGTTVGTLTVWVGYICQNIASPDEWYAGYEVLDGDVNDVTFGDLDYSSTESYYDVAIASDYRYPAYGVSPFSLGILYSKFSSVTDSLLFFSSGDGGNTWNGRQIVVYTGFYLRNVSLSYGITYSRWDGRYFAAWEERDYQSSDRGYIFTSHSDPWYNSPFTTPVRLDNLVTNGADNSKNPAVTTMYNSTADNDSSGLTQLVTFDRYWTPTGDLDVAGGVSLQATSTSYFTPVFIASTYDNELQSDANYDPGFNNFLMTYYDSTTQSLAYVVNNREINNTWVMINGAYNDNTNLAAPHPKVEINPVLLQVAHVWTAEGTSGHGVAMFDAEYSTVGIPPSGQNAAALNLKVYPNPCSTKAELSFTLEKDSQVTITLVSVYGQAMGTVCDARLTAGDHVLPVDVSNLPAGCYYYNFVSGSDKASGQVVVTH
ncbi:MAG TPA: T9SS type A sorting domain-containing protein [Bacteroidales bacterium]|nr:T9SS type A sorting domain-containing protein [Bacteroidales bacterium]